MEDSDRSLAKPDHIDQEGPDRLREAEKALGEYCEDATVGSPKLIAMSDIKDLYEAEADLLVEQRDLSNDRVGSKIQETLAAPSIVIREIRRGALETVVRQVRRTISGHKVTVPGYAKEYGQVSGLMEDLESAHRVPTSPDAVSAKFGAVGRLGMLIVNRVSGVRDI